MAGERGPKGDHGQHGDAGVTGDIGDTGQSGERGDTGLQGATGERGQVGDRGEIGDPGKAGPVGPAGEQGDPGLSSRLTGNTTAVFVAMCVVFFLAVAAMGYANYASRQYAKKNRMLIERLQPLAHQAAQSHKADCSRKRHLAEQINDSWPYADGKKHVADIPPTLFLRGIRRDLAEYDSFQGVRCAPPIIEPRRK